MKSRLWVLNFAALMVVAFSAKKRIWQDCVCSGRDTSYQPHHGAAFSGLEQVHRYDQRFDRIQHYGGLTEYDLNDPGLDLSPWPPVGGE